MMLADVSSAGTSPTRAPLESQPRAARNRRRRAMIYELRTYTAKPGMVAQWEKKWAESYKVREQYSKLGGMWHTELGPLNQILHMWPYESLQHRADVRAKAAKDPSGQWPPPGTSDMLVSQETDILDPVANSPVWDGPRQQGEIYEFRM